MPAGYDLPGVPPEKAAVGLSAFLPGLTPPAGSGAQAYKAAVAGYPGTRGIPAPTRDTVPSPDMGDKAIGGTHASSDAPDVWYPNQYYQRFIFEQPGGAQTPLRYDPVNPGPTTLLPVPAVNAVNQMRAAQYQSSRLAGVVNRVKALPWFPRVAGGGRG